MLKNKKLTKTIILAVILTIAAVALYLTMNYISDRRNSSKAYSVLQPAVDHLPQLQGPLFYNYDNKFNVSPKRDLIESGPGQIGRTVVKMRATDDQKEISLGKMRALFIAKGWVELEIPQSLNDQIEFKYRLNTSSGYPDAYAAVTLYYIVKNDWPDFFNDISLPTDLQPTITNHFSTSSQPIEGYIFQTQSYY